MTLLMSLSSTFHTYRSGQRVEEGQVFFWRVGVEGGGWRVESGGRDRARVVAHSQIRFKACNKEPQVQSVTLTRPSSELTAHSRPSFDDDRLREPSSHLRVSQHDPSTSNRPQMQRT